MGLGFAAVALLTLATWGLLRSLSDDRRRLATAVVFGALDYPCALSVGLLLGSYRPGAEAVAAIALLLVLSVALSLLGAFVADLLAGDRRSPGKAR